MSIDKNSSMELLDTLLLDSSSLVWWINDFASISSIAGLFITSYLLYEAKKLRDSFLMKARLPDLSISLKQNASQLIDATKDWDNSKQNLFSNLAKIKSTLKSIDSKVPKSVKKEINTLIDKIETKKVFIIFSTSKELSEITIDEVDIIYGNLYGIIESLEKFSKNLKWE